MSYFVISSVTIVAAIAFGRLDICAVGMLAVLSLSTCNFINEWLN